MKIRAAVTYDTGAPYKIEEVELDAPRLVKSWFALLQAEFAIRMKLCRTSLFPPLFLQYWGMKVPVLLRQLVPA